MKKYFIDSIYVMTDYMGGWDRQCVEVGWYDKNSNSYFNLDEVKVLFENGETENVGIKDDGSLYMKTCWLDAREAFSIICGVPFGEKDEHKNLLNYADKIGLIHNEPKPILMYTGTKYLEIRKDGLYTVKYILNKDKFNKPNCKFIEKICVGKIKRLMNNYINYHRNGTIEKIYCFSCDDVRFNKEKLELIIDGIPNNEVYKRELIDAIRNLDIELLISNSSLVNFSNVLSACEDWCRDCGQYHWIGEEYKEEKSNVYWFDK